MVSPDRGHHTLARPDAELLAGAIGAWLADCDHPGQCRRALPVDGKPRGMPAATAPRPLRVEDPRYRHVLAQAWVDAAMASGLPANDDFNGARQDGVGFHQLTQRQGERWSAADAYLRPALQRDNLTAETDALVVRVLIDNGRAVGVRYRHQGAEREAKARAAVILCGGAVNSPQLLMLSGIGPADQLRAHGIDPIVDAPAVGEGLQDHPVCLAGWATPQTPSYFEELTGESMALWQQQRQGPMASFVNVVGGFGRSRDGLAAPDLQDLQYDTAAVVASVGPVDEGGLVHRIVGPSCGRRR